MSKPRKGSFRFDYSVFNDKGIKVPLNPSPKVSTMEDDSASSNSKILEEDLASEKKLSLKIKRYIAENDVDLLFDISDLEDAIRGMDDLVNSFEDVHVALGSQLKDQYAAKFPDFDKQISAVTEWIKKAKLAIKDKKKANFVPKIDPVAQLKTRLKTEEKFLFAKIDEEITMYNDENSSFISDIERNISSIEELSKNYTSLFIQIEELGPDFLLTFGDRFKNQSLKMTNFIRTARKNVQKKKVEEQASVSKLKVQEEENKLLLEKNAKINTCKTLFDNVCERITLLEKKCLIDIKSLGDTAVLDLKKDFKTFDSEFNDVLDRIAKLGESYPGQYEETFDMMDKTSKMKSELKAKLDGFKADLEQQIVSRDLSEEKIKNASLLDIKLAPFKGYDSTLDYYSFKTEFQRLVGQRVHAKLLPDILKSRYLEGQAFQIVKEIDDLNEIWDRLQQAFGNVTTMLSLKIKTLDKNEPLSKIRSEEKLVMSLTKLKNCMVELSSLAKKHSIQTELYHTSNLSKIFQLVGKQRQRKVIKNVRNTFTGSVDNEQLWQNTVTLLDDEIQDIESMVLFNGPSSSDDRSGGRGGQGNSNNPPNGDKSSDGDRRDSSFHVKDPAKRCTICGKEDHVPTISDKGKLFINYFSCEIFVKMSTKERFEALRKKHLCFQCLTPGHKAGHDGNCFDKFNCPHDSHKSHKRGMHVLICYKHKGDDANKKLFEEYKAKFITFANSAHKDFSKNISISLHSSHNALDGSVKERSIYLLQKIKIGEHTFNLMYDNGCSDAGFKKAAIDKLFSMNLATCTLPGPLTLEGVSGLTAISHHGRYKVSLPLHNGETLELEGLCMDALTGEFPSFPLKEVENDLQTAFESSATQVTNCAGVVTSLPKLPKEVGGETDIMIGSQYLKFYPEKVLKLASGLTLYESMLMNSDGTRGVVCGPHRSFTEFLQRQGSHISMSVYFTDQLLAYKRLKNFEKELTLLTDFVKDDSMDVFPEKCSEIVLHSDQNFDPNHVHSCCFFAKKPKNFSKFESIECAGTEISYRCVRCRGCLACKTSGKVDSVSVQEEIEDEVVQRSVTVHLEKGFVVARLPFLCDPSSKLAPNYHAALKIYKLQVKRLNASPKSKVAVISAFQKLRDLNFVAFVEDLNIDQQEKVRSSKVQHFLPWRVVTNKNSVTTPVRPVFDASHPTSTGFSINHTLAKGKNHMNNLVMMFIRWGIRRFAFHTDVQKMYNSIRLHEDDWCYQLFLLNSELDPDSDPKIGVIMTLIYGVKPSGNQAEFALRETARLQSEEYPRVYEVVQNDIYVDDCLSGEDTVEGRDRVTEDMATVLGKTRFFLKGCTYSGCDPPEHLKQPDNTINVAGMKWFSKNDRFGLNLTEQTFGRKSKGRKSQKYVSSVIPDSFTRLDCAGRVAEIFDLVGRFAPIVGGLKLDLNILSKRKLDWDHHIPDDLLSTWKENFELISQLGELRFKRLIVPEDAVDLKMDTIEISDASLLLACSAVYGRFKRKNGSYSCQLIFARTKIIPEGFNIPRAELIGAVLNATTGHIVNLSLEDFITERIHLVDNQIVLFWINNRRSQLKQWTRNRVIETTRLTDRLKWFFIDSENNMADLGTRKGAKISDISEESDWINGKEWCRGEKSDFPIKSVDDLKLTDDELKDYNAELNDLLDEDWIHQHLSKSYSMHYVYTNFSVLSDSTAEKVKKRYEFSKYILDPNKFRFRKVIRIVAILFLFLSKMLKRLKEPRQLSQNHPGTALPNQFQFSNDQYLVTQGYSKAPFLCKKGLTIALTEDSLKFALSYYFQKGTLEVKHFLPKDSYKNISKEIDGILQYSGRILPSQKIDNELQLADVCTDLTSSTFCVPILDKHSPISYSIINEVHWHSDDARHSGNETVWRFVQLIAFVIEGKPLVKTFREECPRCRYLKKKAIEVAMGPISDDHLKIAPPFYSCQVDICGPFSSYSSVNKRATVKIWFVVFCCCVTGAVDIKVMEDYSTSSFVLAFIRFACRVGYPYKLLPDAGSQLVKGCDSMKITFTDIKGRLSECGVIFEVCPVGAHYMHGKVERKIRSVKESFEKHLQNERLSVIEWETLGDTVANSLNNLPIAVSNETKDLENIDLLTPNRLMLGRNNNRCPVGPVQVTEDIGKILQRNEKIFSTWFRAWLVSYVPSLIIQPKWFKSDRDPKIGDIVLFLKSEKEFDKIYQYGMISDVKASRDGRIRQLEIVYQNSNENTKRFTSRGTREVVIIHHLDELGLIRELNVLAANAS